MAITIDGTTGIASVDGSAGSPSVRGTDANSGILYTSDAIKFSTGGVQRAVVDNGGLSSPGHILQVVQSVETDTSSQDAIYSSPGDLGISCQITPKAASSKILVECNLVIGSQDSFGAFLFLLRGSTQIMLSDAAGNRTRCSKYITTYAESNNASPYKVGDVNIKYLDSPSYNLEDSITYKVQSGHWNSKYIYLNKCHNDTNLAAYDGRSVSTMTLMEVAA